MSNSVVLFVLLSYRFVSYILDQVATVACIQIDAFALMSSRAALRPSFSSANVFSQAFSSCLRAVHRASISMLSILKIW